MFLPHFIPGILAFSLKTSLRKLAPIFLFFGLGIVLIIYFYLILLGANKILAAWPICLFLGITIPRCREIKLKYLAKLGKIIARYSYGIYLIHGPWIDFSFRYLKISSVLIQYTIFLFGLGGLVYFCYNLIEKPCMKFGGKIADHMSE